MRRSISSPIFSSLPILACSAAVSLLAGCGTGSGDVNVRSSSATQQAIINGDGCGAEVFPTAVAVLVDAKVSFQGFGETDIKTVICTGTLIAPDTVLTAAHCLDATGLTFGFGDVVSETYSVTFDADLVALASQGQQQGVSVELPESRIEAAAFFAHETFDLNAFAGVDGPGDYFDIGVIFLNETVDVTPEIVITAEEAVQIEVGATVSIVGWGQQVPTNGPLEAPPEGSVGLKVCAVSTINEVGATEFQVGGDSTTSRKCHGDSGWPTYMNVETPLTIKQRVIGITSHAYDAEDCAKGGVDTRIDAYLEWLDAKMVAACDDDTRAWCEVKGVIPPSFYEAATNEPEGEPEPGTEIPKSELIGSCAASGAGTESTTWAGVFALLALAGLARRRRS